MRKKLIIIISVLFILFMGIGGSLALAEDTSTSPSSDSFNITNNVGKSDVIHVTNLSQGDVVKVYTAASGGRVIGGAAVPLYQSEVNINVAQLGSSAGSVFISVTSKGMLESERTEADYSAEPQTSAPDPGNIVITNNVKKADTVYMDNLNDGDVVKVYNAASGGKLLGSARVPLYQDDATVNITQLGSTAGKVYLTVTSTGMLESNRTEADYTAEPVSPAPDANNVIISNNAGVADTIYISGLQSADVIKVYNAASTGKLISTGTVPKDAGEITLKISQLGSSAGSVFITDTSTGMLESSRTEADYQAEPVTPSLDINNITITNNAGKSDNILITGLQEKDSIKVYNASSGGKLLASGTVPTDQSEASLNVAQLGSTGGSIFITNSRAGMLPSARIEADFGAEAKSTAPAQGDIIVSNNVGAPDTIDINNISTGDIIKVYNSASGGTLLGSMTTPQDVTEKTFNLKPLSTTSSSIYVTKTTVCKLESDRTQINYPAKPKTSVPNSDDIAVTNYSGQSDIITVNNISTDQVVKVYDSPASGKLLISGTVASGKTDIMLSVKQLGTGSGSVYVTVTTKGMLESDRTQADYAAELKSASPDSSDVSVTNYALKSGTIVATALSEGDIIKVYSAAKGGTVLATGTVPVSSSQVSINIKTLSQTAGSVYLSVTSKGMQESDKTEVDYGAVSKSIAPSANNITVANNSGEADSVTVSGLQSGDIVKIYNAASAGNILGTGTVAQFGNSVAISIPQLGISSGSIYLTATSANETESGRTQVNYSGEPVSTAPNVTNINITNNAIISDTVRVFGLNAGDVVKVYNASSSGTLLGSATVATGGSDTTVSIKQLGTAAGTVYVSVTSTGNLESSLTAVNYASESASSAPDAGNIVITNNYLTPDTVKVINMTPGDIIKVYDSKTGGNLLGSATAASGNSSAAVSINQIGSTAGNVYVSITTTGKSESSRTTAAYQAEGVSTPPDSSNITIVNNAGKAGTVTVANLMGGDVITVYDAAVGGNVLGTATVGTYDISGTVSVTQLGATAGSIYVSIASKGKMESSRTMANYTAKPLSTAPDTGNITIVNNAGIPDTVTVTNLNPQDIVNVYDSVTGGNLLGSAAASTTNLQVVIPITQLGANGGSVYATVTSSGKLESNRTKADFSTEGQSNAPAAGNIEIENNVGKADTVTVTGLIAGDTINVYTAGTGGSLLGTAVVPSGNSEALVSIQQIGTSPGSLYISVKSVGKTESSRTQANYNGESAAPDPANIIIVNNAVIADTVSVSGLKPNDLVRVYDSLQDGNLLGYAVVPPNGTSAAVAIPQLSSNAGSAYISVTSVGMSESSRTTANYIAEQSSNPPYIGSITVVNNLTGTPDTVTVTGLLPADVINVYSTPDGDTLLGSAMVTASGGQAVAAIPQLGSTAGSVYISLTSLGKTESTRTKVNFASENP